MTHSTKYWNYECVLEFQVLLITQTVSTKSGIENVNAKYNQLAMFQIWVHCQFKPLLPHSK